MSKYELDEKKNNRIEQGDIYKNIEYIENVEIDKQTNEVEISKIVFPYVIVLSQDCDLQQSSIYFSSDNIPEDQDKQLLSIIVAPLYNEELFLSGEHLADDTISFKMQSITKEKKGKLTTPYRNLINNETPRYHHISFAEGTKLTNMVIDFKHFFTINISYLYKCRHNLFVCKLKPLYRELITQRYANFLSRIGLP